MRKAEFGRGKGGGVETMNDENGNEEGGNDEW
jgi:hypothetical protein